MRHARNRFSIIENWVHASMDVGFIGFGPIVLYLLMQRCTCAIIG